MGYNIHMKFKHPLAFRYMQLFWSEFFGTYILLFIGCLSCVPKMGTAPTILEVSFAFGLAITTSIHIFGPISKCHINPIITQAALIMGKIDIQRSAVYWAAQFLGALAGYGSVVVVTPAHLLYSSVTLKSGNIVKRNACQPAVHPELTALHGVVVEFIATAILIFICAAAWDVRNRSKGDGLGTRFGLSIVAIVIATVRYSSTNVNPARSLAPALINWDWENHWVFWVGPILGSAFAAVIYRYLFDLRQEDGDSM